jgi:hypothetical protein
MAGDEAAIETLAAHGMSISLWIAAGPRLARLTSAEELALEAAYDAALIAAKEARS